MGGIYTYITSTYMGISALYLHNVYIISTRVFANDPEDRGSIPGQVIPKTLKMVLDTSLLNTQHYKVLSSIKWSNPGIGIAPSPYTLV